MIACDVRVINRAVLDNVVNHRVFEVSFIWIYTHSLGFSSEFGCSDIFLGEYFKIFMDCLYKIEVLGIIGINAWYNHFILVEFNLPILGADNVLPILVVRGDVEPDLFKIWDAGDVSNPFLVDPTLNGIKVPLLVGECSS